MPRAGVVVFTHLLVTPLVAVLLLLPVMLISAQGDLDNTPARVSIFAYFLAFFATAVPALCSAAAYLAAATWPHRARAVAGALAGGAFAGLSAAAMEAAWPDRAGHAVWTGLGAAAIVGAGCLASGLTASRLLADRAKKSPAPVGSGADPDQ